MFKWVFNELHGQCSTNYVPLKKSHNSHVFTKPWNATTSIKFNKSLSTKDLQVHQNATNNYNKYTRTGYWFYCYRLYTIYGNAI